MTKVTELEMCIYHMIGVWQQYNSWGKDVGEGCITHSCMGIGEDAVDFLEDLGYVEDQGWIAVLTDKAKDLIERVGEDRGVG